MSSVRVAQLTAQLDELTRTAQSINNRYAAHLSLHASAVLERDKDLVLEHRKSLHVLLDRILDNGEQVQKVTDELTHLLRHG